jgi:predicted Co/Zn/Cd cation transporter (cation efflux family)
MSGHVYCYHYTTCTKPGKWAVMCIVTITLPVQSQENERSCVLLPLHYLYKARKMSGHVYCYHYTTCTKPGKWTSCVLFPLHYLYKDRKMSGHVYCFHYTTCTKPGKWAVMCIVSITLPVQSQVNERSCVLLPLHYLYKARTMSGNVYCYQLRYLYKGRTMGSHSYCYHYTTCTKPGQWAVMCIVTITLPVQSQEYERSCV